MPLRILVAYAHPDDESFGPSAVLARYAREGAAIYGLFATRGEHGDAHLDPEPPPRVLGRLREQDLRDATAAIGFARVDILDYEDGTVAAVPSGELEGHVWAALQRYRPQVVLTFGPGGITRHPDHIAIHRATMVMFYQALAEGLGVSELYYDAVPAERAQQMKLEDVPDGQPNTWIDVSETQPVKLEALRIHARHIADAREMVQRLEQEAVTVAPLYRAWPPVPPGQVVTGFLQR